MPDFQKMQDALNTVNGKNAYGTHIYGDKEFKYEGKKAIKAFEKMIVDRMAGIGRNMHDMDTFYLYRNGELVLMFNGNTCEFNLVGA